MSCSFKNELVDITFSDVKMMLNVDNYASETTSEAGTEKFSNGLECKNKQKRTFTAKTDQQRTTFHNKQIQYNMFHITCTYKSKTTLDSMFLLTFCL